MSVSFHSTVRKWLSFCVLFSITFSYIFFIRDISAVACFILSVIYLCLIGKGSLTKFFPFMQKLYKRKRLIFYPAYLNELGLREILFPHFFTISAFTCFLLLFVAKTLKLLRPDSIYGLFLPIWLLFAARILDSFLKSKNKRILYWRQFFVKNVYHRNPFLVKTYILASYVLAIGLVFAYSLFAFKSSLYSLEWYSYGFFDKRTVYLTYLLFMVGFLFTPYFYSAFVHSNSLPEVIKTSKATDPFWKKCICFGVAVLIATHIWGPPFNLELYTAGPDTHEVVHLAPLLAIDQGRLPFTEAQVQYGPGTQFFQYIYMKKFGFDLLHLRESFLVLHYVFTLILFLCVWFYLKPFAATIVSVFFLAFSSPLVLFGFNQDGVPWGYFGWVNGFRYLASPLLAMAMGHLFTQKVPSRMHSFFVGCMYGVLLYMAQENFSCGIFTLALGSMLAYTSKYLTLPQLKKIGLYFLLGVLLPLMPISAFYAYHHQLGEFIAQYFKVSSAVMQGFSNSSWSSGSSDPYFLAYILTPIILFAIGFYNLYCEGKNHLSIERDKLKALMLVISAIALYQISLFRADHSHFVATCLVLPILFGLVCCAIIRNPFLSKKETIGYVSAFLLFLSAIYLNKISLKFEILTNPFYRYFVSSINNIPSGHVFFKPFGFYKDPHSKSASYNKTNTIEFISEMKAIKEIVGERSTIVTNLEGNHTSSIYFFANLKIGTKMIETLHSVINSKDREKFIEEIRNNPIQCLITNHLHEKEAVAFLERFPNAVIYRRVYDDIPYHIICDGNK